MPTLQSRHADTITAEHRPRFPASLAADKIFSALERLHGLSDHERELLQRAAAGLQFIRSTDSRSQLERQLFRAALADLDAADRYVVETAAYYAADIDRCPGPGIRSHTGRRDERRALWLAAILRLAAALCPADSREPERVYATWTDEILYIEFDGNEPSGAQLAQAKARLAALEMVSGLRALIATSESRRGAA